jgi:lipopolysaccharide export system permease protein
MRLHDRYLFRELLTPLAFCLGGFLIFWISYFFFTEMDTIQEHKLGVLDAAEYAVAMLPGFFVMVLPITLLLALLYALTHHARYHELTALRAAGISLWRVCLPYFVVGLATVGIYFAVNEWVAPWTATWSDQILARNVPVKSGSKTKARFINCNFRSSANHFWHIDEYDSAAKTMLKPNVTWTLPDGSGRTMRAEGAARTNGAWTFYNVQMFAQRGGQTVPLFATNQFTDPEFKETPQQILTNLKFNDSEGLLASRSLDIPLSDLRAYWRQNPQMPAKQKSKVMTKYYGRLAAPWTCFVVVMIAIPFGAKSGRRNLFFGVAGSIFICFGYFILQQVSLAFGMNGQLPSWLAAWLPNLLFATVGGFLIFRTR